MHIIYTSAQARRLAGIPEEGDDVPDYPVTTDIPKKVLDAIIDDTAYLDEYGTDRLFLYDDGGYIIIYQLPGELDGCNFGLPNPTEYAFENATELETDDGVWVSLLELRNNETGIHYLFPKRFLSENSNMRSTLEWFEKNKDVNDVSHD